MARAATAAWTSTSAARSRRDLRSVDQVRFVTASTVAEFAGTDDIDVVSRRLTWELRREAPLGFLFGPIVFYDGQGFLVSKTLA